MGVVDIDKRWIAINGHRLKIITRSHVVDGIDDVAETRGKGGPRQMQNSVVDFFCVVR